MALSPPRSHLACAAQAAMYALTRACLADGVQRGLAPRDSDCEPRVDARDLGRSPPGSRLVGLELGQLLHARDLALDALDLGEVLVVLLLALFSAPLGAGVVVEQVARFLQKLRPALPQGLDAFHLRFSLVVEMKRAAP
jgi:hypothetical protein